MEKSRIVLLTQKDSKRERYFFDALTSLGMECALYYNFDEYLRERLAYDIVKIDPPDIRDYGVEELGIFTEKYINNLRLLDAEKTINFLNTPSAIIMALDKYETKIALTTAKIPTPSLLSEKIKTFDELLSLMKLNRTYRVFIKPRFGSGAAGVCAFAWNFQKSKGALYTSLAEKKGTFINTKKVQKSTDTTFCKSVISFVLSLGAVVEHWVAKPMIDGYTFDFRVVWQFGKIETIITRGAKSPITNLHLNDMALPEKMAIDFIDTEALQKICEKAVATISGLASAGLDVLWTPEGYQVIEINSQGDLIYRDIYAENTIYKNQAHYLLELKNKL